MGRNEDSVDKGFHVPMVATTTSTTTIGGGLMVTVMMMRIINASFLLN
jgi:hypothetical protein